MTKFVRHLLTLTITMSLFVVGLSSLAFANAPEGNIPTKEALADTETNTDIVNFFEAIDNKFYFFKYSEADLTLLLKSDTDPKVRTLLGALIKFQNNRRFQKSSNAYVELAHDLVQYYDLRGTDSAGYQHLSDIELLAIRFYTGDDYRIINTALRGDIQLAKDLSSYLAVLDRALLKLPPFHGYALRGTNLPADVAKSYTLDGVVSDQAYLSASIQMNYPGKYQFKIYSSSGRLIDPISQNKGEGEVLFPRNTHFRILKRDERGDQVFFELEEIEAAIGHMNDSLAILRPHPSRRQRYPWRRF